MKSLFLSIFLLFAESAIAQLSGTATQYILTYTATNTSQCAVEISESNTYSPVVHAVDGALITNANLDGQTNAGVHTFVIGQRTTIAALDAKNYSLALQANTVHYYRISTCVASPLTGSFTTSNIPAGRTFADHVPLDANGVYIFPSTTGTNGESFIDPLTGAKIIRIGSSSDDAQTSDWWSSGSVRISSYLPDAGGYYTATQTQNGFSRMYWVNTTNGASAYLGLSKISVANADYRSPVSNWDPTDAKSWWTSDPDGVGKAHLVRFTYTGTRTNGESATLLGTSVDYTPTNTIPDLIHTFDSTFDIVRFGTNANGANGCSLIAVQKVGSNIYGLGNCQLYQQNSPAWAFVLNLTSPSVGAITVVAARPMHLLSQCRWCGIHSVYNIGDSKLMYFVLEALQFPADSSAKGPWEVTLTSAVTTAGQTAFTVNGEPVASGSGIPPDGTTSLQNVAVGDVFVAEDNGEKVQVTVKTSSTNWTVARGCTTASGVVTCNGTGATTHLNSTKWWAYCVPWGVDMFANFIDDPTGATQFFDSYMQGGHRVTRNNLKDFMEDISGGMPWKDGAPANVPVTGLIDVAPTYASLRSPANGNGYVKHPSMESGNFAYDVWDFGFNGSWIGTPNLTAVGGKTHTYDYDMVGITFDFDKLPVFALAGSTLMKNVSGVSSVLPDSAADAWCFAKNTNECFSGSTAGHFYVTFSATPTFLGCAAGGEHALAGNFCAQHTTPYGHALTQFNLTAGNQTGNGPSPNLNVPIYGAQKNRVLARGAIARYGQMDNYPNGHPLPDNSFVAMPLRLDGVNDSHWLVKVPPAWVDDGVDRTNFINISVLLSGGATYVNYGYEENGLRSSFYCTQRKEACKVSGTPGTIVQVPAIPDRVVFTQLQGSSSIVPFIPGAIFSAPSPSMFAMARKDAR